MTPTDDLRDEIAAALRASVEVLAEHRIAQIADALLPVVAARIEEARRKGAHQALTAVRDKLVQIECASRIPALLNAEIRRLATPRVEVDRTTGDEAT